MDGVKCSLVGCSTHDFLPFLCQRCDGIYCLEHRSRFVHDCRDCETFNEAPKRDLSHLPSVKAMLAAVETRFQAAASKAAPQEHWGNVIQSSTSKSSAHSLPTSNSVPTVFTRSLEKLRELQLDSSKSPEIKQRALRTQQMLMKRRAMGNLSIPEENRIYLTIHFVAPHSSLASSEELFPDTDEDPLCLQYVFFHCNMPLGEVLHHLKETHFTMIRSKFHLSENFALQDRVAMGLYTMDSPDWRLWDRDVKLGHLCRNFEEAWITIVMIEDVIQSQRALSTPPSISELQHHQYENPTSHTVPPAAHISSSSSAPPSTVPSVYSITKGDYAWYHRGSNGIALATLKDAEEHNIPVILVKIIGVHHDDFPNIYYTIGPINPPTIQRHGASDEECDRLSFHSEKQTDSNRVIAAPDFHPAAKSASSETPSQIDLERQRNELLQQKQQLLQLFASKAVSSGLWGTDAFTVTITYGGKDEKGVTIAPRVTVGELREYARCIVALAKLGTMNAALARAVDVKLITKGVQLKQDSQLVRDTKLGPGGKLMIMG